MFGDKPSEYLTLVGARTGFTVFDIYTSSLETGVDGYPAVNGGLFPRLSNIIGASGGGKSTFVIEACAGAVDSIRRRSGPGFSEIRFYDAEQTTRPRRIMDIAGWDDQTFLGSCQLTHQSVSLVDLANKIIAISEYKKKNARDLTLSTGIIDVSGREVRNLAPTFIIVDSLAAVNPNGVEDLVETNKAGELKEVDRLASNMTGAQDAKAWTIFIRKIKPFLEDGNIALILINHKVSGIQTNMYAIPEVILPYLRPDEKLKGGSEIIYQSYLICDFRPMSPKFDDRNPAYGEKIQGFPSRLTVVKNKNNTEGVNFPLVFDKSRGFVHDLSDFEYLNDRKYGLSGSGNGLCLEVLPELKFTRKNLLEALQEHPLLAAALKFTTTVHAGNSMLFRVPSPSLADFGMNLPLDQRALIFDGFCDPYPGTAPGGLPGDVERLRHEGNFQAFFPEKLDWAINVPRPEDVQALEAGFNPFGVEEYGPDTKRDEWGFKLKEV
jgi:RecA/RadA recombinase